MPRKLDTDDANPAAIESPEAWKAQEPCLHCGGRSGRNPTTGIAVKDGHTYNCPTRMSPVAPSYRRTEG